MIVDSAAKRWSDDLATWAIPEEILSQAHESPWIHPPALFQVGEDITSNFSHDRAREALRSEASLLDIGCGGGIATFALLPEVSLGVGVDHQQAMLDMYRANGRDREIDVQAIFGNWPEIEQFVPVCDVVAAHHVAYNVADIVPFLSALNRHARSRVVLEIPTRHPLSSMSSAWRHFWNLERPVGPTHEDLVQVLMEMGIQANCEVWSGQIRTEKDLDQASRFMRIRLCLPPDRESDVRDFLAENPLLQTRELATIWWDVA